MTSAVAMPPASSRGLPPLRGGLLALYWLLWFALVSAAFGVLALSLFEPSVQPLIVGLRLLKAAIVIAVAAILLRRRQRDPVAALLSLSLLLWTVTSSIDFTDSMTSVPVVLDRFRFLLFTIALLLFPTGEWRPRWARNLAIITVAVFAVGVAEAVQWLPSRSFLPLAIPCVIAAIATLVVRFRTASSTAERLQLKWVAFGLISGVGCILSARAGFALMPGSAMPAATPVILEALFQSGIVLVALGFLVSLLRYRLFDVETAVSRSAAYGVLTLALLATFAGSEALIETLGQNYFGMGFGNVAAAMAAAIAAVLLTPLHHRISDWAEQHFQRDLVTLKRQLPELLADLSTDSSTRRLGAAVLPAICDAIHATRAGLMVNGSMVAVHRVDMRDARSWSGRPTGPHMACDRADPLFPVRIGLRCPRGTAQAWLLFGARPDGSLFAKDETEAIQTIAPALRQALSAATERDLKRARDRQLVRAILDKTRKLSERIEALECVTT